MLEINISEFSDFCFGVKRAISLAERALKKYPRPIYSLGPIIHNRRVINELSKKGLNVIGDYRKIDRGAVVTRSHGIHPVVRAGLEKRSINIIDATCPFVKNAQLIAKKLKQDGYRVIIVGDKGHPEVKFLKSVSGDNSMVIAARGDAKKLKVKDRKIGIIAQTTQSMRNFREVLSELLKKEFNEVRVFNTICSDVQLRQESAEKCSKNSDMVLVVGGKNSANTKRLYEICRNIGTPVHHIETGREIKNRWLVGRRRIGIVSGASTPRWIVEEVRDKLNKVRRS